MDACVVCSAPMLATLVLCCALGFAPSSDERAEAEALFKSGQAKYETHDYAGAIADFTDAYNLALELDDEGLRDDVLARLAYNLARAHVSAYDVDREPSHLELARRLLADYRGHERQMGRDPDSDTDILRLEAELRERERGLKDDTPSEAPKPAPDPEPKVEPQPEPIVDAQPRARARRRAGISFLALAPAFAGLGIAGGIMAAQASEDFADVTTGGGRLDAQRRGRMGDVLLGVGIGLAAASAITGVALIVVARPDRDRKLALTLRPNGVALEGRF